LYLCGGCTGKRNKGHPHESLERVSSVLVPALRGGELIGTVLSGSLAGVLHDFHVTVLGSNIGPVDTICMARGLSLVAADISALVNPRRVRLARNSG
jgi:hypothetical protein